MRNILVRRPLAHHDNLVAQFAEVPHFHLKLPPGSDAASDEPVMAGRHHRHPLQGLLGPGTHLQGPLDAAVGQAKELFGDGHWLLVRVCAEHNIGCSGEVCGY